MDDNGQNPGTPGNSTNGETGTPAPASITDVMNALDGNEPETKPAENGGEKVEGKEKTDQKAELPKWMSQLSRESLEDADLVKQLAKFQNMGDLAKSYASLEKKLGSSINIPGENATEEEITAFYSKLGKPESAEGYSIKEESAAPFKALAFKANLTDSQAKAVFEGLTAIGKEQARLTAENMQKIADESDKALKAEWGKDFGANLELAKRGIAAYGGNALGQKLKASGLIYDADVVKMFALLGKQSSESSIVTRGTGGSAQQYKTNAEGGHFDFGI